MKNLFQTWTQSNLKNVTSTKQIFTLTFYSKRVLYLAKWYASCRRSWSWMTWPTENILLYSCNVQKAYEQIYFCTPHIGGALLDLPHFGVVLVNAKLESRALQRELHTSVPLPSGAGWETFIASCKWKYPHQFFLVSPFLSGSENRVCADERLHTGRFFLSQGICKWERYKQVALRLDGCET
jgi:hypothetical protein